MRNNRVSCITGLLLAIVTSAAAQTPLGTAFTYQGQLKESGNPASGTYDLRFVLYDSSVGGTPQGSAVCTDNVSVTDGLFTVVIDFGAQFAGQERFLGIEVRPDTGLNCGNLAGFVALSPRQALTATPYALYSINADRLDGLDSSAFLQAIPNPLTLSGSAAGSHVIRGNNSNNSGQSAGVFGHASGTGGGFGLQGQQRGGAGVVPTYGVGVFGSSDTSYGVAGFSGTGDAMWALALGTAGATNGLNAESRSTSGAGVRARASATSGETYGVFGQSDSTSGHGVYGWATATTGTTYGVFGKSDSANGKGVWGVAGAGGTSATPYGVLGYCNTATNGFAVYATGDMGASGVKPFRIDHPDDPENKYLLHYAAESPEVINFYRGTVELDGAGGAEVELPHYFAKINKTPSYQLTAVGAPMPMLHVAEKISEEAMRTGEQAGPSVASPLCSFRIAGGVPGGEVSWEVKAQRNDLRMRLHGAPVEREKTGPERGKYQHPEYYGRPPEMGMDYDAERDRPSPPATPQAARQN